MTQAEAWRAFSELDLVEVTEDRAQLSEVQTETQPSETPADKDLAATLVHLLRNHPAVRRAVVEVVMSCPNIKWEL